MFLPPLDGAPVTFLRATTSFEGYATFDFDVPCDDVVSIYGLAYDTDGTSPANADAFTFAIDVDPAGPADLRWEYGCDNSTKGQQWNWHQVRDTGLACTPGDLATPLSMGAHTVSFLNAEISNNNPQFNFSGLAAIAITNDPTYLPNDDYEPNP